MLRVEQDSGARYFLAEAGAMLYQNEPTNSLILGLAEGVAAGTILEKTPSLFLRLCYGDETWAAAAQVNHPNLALSATDTEGVEALVEFLSRIPTNIGGVVAEAATADAFSQQWARASGKHAKLNMGQKLYRLDMVTPPTGVPGRLRLAEARDRELVAKWMHEFVAEAVPVELQAEEAYRLAAENKISLEQVWIWEVEGRPASTLHTNRPTKNGICLSAVYTPRDLRGHGYASALVAGASQAMLNLGKKFCVLYTDVTNPISNKIYSAVGYREVCESKHFVFV